MHILYWQTADMSCIHILAAQLHRKFEQKTYAGQQHISLKTCFPIANCTKKVQSVFYHRYSDGRIDPTDSWKDWYQRTAGCMMWHCHQQAISSAGWVHCVLKQHPRVSTYCLMGKTEWITVQLWNNWILLLNVEVNSRQLSVKPPSPLL